VDRDEDARAFMIARELIAQHGDAVGAFLQARIDESMAAGDLEQFSDWFIIRNAVALTLSSGTTLQ
jgi:hypothetical protein